MFSNLGIIIEHTQDLVSLTPTDSKADAEDFPHHFGPISPTQSLNTTVQLTKEKPVT